MADVLVVEPRKADAFVLGVFVLVVPVGDHDLAIGVEAGEHQQDRVVEDPPRLRVVAGEKIVGELGGRLRAGDFGRVKTERLAHHRYAFNHQLFHFGLGRAGILDPDVHFPEAVEIRHVRGRRDDHEKVGMAFGRWAEVGDLDPIALPFEKLEVFDDLVPSS